MSVSIEALYLDAQRSFVQFARELTADDWAVPVPCCPGWTVRDVLSHVSGITDDAINGRMDDVASESWTAAQVERNREFGVDELIDRWDGQAPLFASVLGSGPEARPPFDCHTHEHDIRHALGRPGNRDSTIVHAAASRLIEPMEGPIALMVELPSGTLRNGQPESDRTVTLSDVTAFEVFRSRLGRRSLAQVQQYVWSGPPEQIATVIAGWFNFGPSEIDIHES